MEFLTTIKDQIPDYAKDIRLNLDGVIARPSLAPEDALSVVLAAAFAAKSRAPVDAFKAARAAEANAALTAAALMGMTTQRCATSAGSRRSSTPRRRCPSRARP